MARGPEPREGTLGWRLKRAAKRAGLTAEDIAHSMKQKGVNSSPTSVRRWWRAGNEGGRNPRGPELATYAALCSTTVEEITGNDEHLPASVLDALVLISRGLLAGESVAASAERALGQPGVMSREDEARLAPEAEIIRRFLRDLGALTDADLRAVLAEIHQRARQEGRRGGEAIH
jgi:transcriptional regulator with XRE-family HTH domain